VRLLLTRPEQDAERTAAALRAQGHQAIIAPLVRIETISDAQIGAGPWAAILVTSANAAHTIKAHARFEDLCAVRVFTVGERSAHAMRAAGFADVTSAGGSVNDLARLVTERMNPQTALLYLAGEERSGDLAGDLRAQNFVVHTAVVYRAVAESKLPAAAASALANGIDGVLHFSRRSAETYVNAARDADVLARALSPVHFCLSAQVAEPLTRAGAAAIRVAPRPMEAALIELLGSMPV
jgi:uroporphyrinogen-III synthase